MSPAAPRRRTRSRALALLAVGALAAGLAAGVPAGATEKPRPGSGVREVPAPVFEPGRYVVLLREPGASQYDGGRAGLPRTRGTALRPFNPRSSAVRTYSEALLARQDRLARRVGAEPLRRLTLTANGFTADLTARQATRLAGDPGVLLVTRERRRQLDTWNTPESLGLTGREGAWRRFAGGRDDAGDGVVVGVLDSGIWPEAASFRGRRLTSEPRGRWGIARRGETVRMTKADGGRFRGRCQQSHREGGSAVDAEAWTPRHCSTKLVGARYYPEEFLATVPVADRSPHEVVSPRDGNGHGTHTAGTAAGRHVEDVVVRDVRFGALSGMAPAAKVASYKVCFDDADVETGDCFDGAILAAVEDAVEDGVDVINFSISGATDTVVDPTELAFEGAAEAGVFVATSAGNAGPGESTVAHNSPWVTTVAATTHRSFENTLVLGDGTRLRGASAATRPLSQAPLVDSADVPAAGATTDDARLCVPGSLDPARVAGRIVVCTRGDIDRVDKSQAVQQAGGVGMVLANVDPGSLDADLHSVPTIHIADSDSATVFGYLDAAGEVATASFRVGDVTGLSPTPVPQIVEFSSRGPALANGSDLLKPDLAAPGGSILAAVAPPANDGMDYALYSGTSMASPHVAGLAAFLMAERPRWTPMMVKSALMTTATDARDADGRRLRDHHAQGAGLVRPRQAFDPGLFVTSDAKAWRRFAQGQGMDLGLEPLAAKDLNGPSLAQGQVMSETTFTRTFTASRAGAWKVSVDVPGFVAHTAGRLVFDGRGDRQRLTIRFARTDAPLGRFSQGRLVLDGPTRLRLPIALRPVSVKAPEQVTGTGTQGSVTVPVTGASTGELPVEVSGPVASEVVSDVARNITDGYEDEQYHCFEVLEGSRAARFDLDAEDDTGDMDLLVIPTDQTCETAIGDYVSSATPSADEQVVLLDPEPGFYVAAVDPYAAPDGADTLAWRLDVWDVSPGRQDGTLAADPNPVPIVNGQTTSYDAVWSGLQNNRRYLGMFHYEGALAPTSLLVDTRP